MRELMGDQLSTFARSGREPAVTENDVVAHRVGLGIHVARRLLRGGVSVDPHSAEIMPEARLEIGPHRRIERPARGAQHVVHDGWRARGGGWMLRAGFFCSCSSSSHSAHLRLICGGAAAIARPGAGIRIT